MFVPKAHSCLSLEVTYFEMFQSFPSCLIASAFVSSSVGERLPPTANLRTLLSRAPEARRVPDNVLTSPVRVLTGLELCPSFLILSSILLFPNLSSQCAGLIPAIGGPLPRDLAQTSQSHCKSNL